jgi:hypothetical protein
MIAILIGIELFHVMDRGDEAPAARLDRRSSRRCRGCESSGASSNFRFSPHCDQIAAQPSPLRRARPGGWWVIFSVIAVGMIAVEAVEWRSATPPSADMNCHPPMRISQKGRFLAPFSNAWQFVPNLWGLP